MVAPDEAPGVLITVLSIALVVAIGVWILAAVWIAARFLSTRLERRYLPDVARWSRRRAGVPEAAGPWACPACSSVNAATVVACYRCGGPRVPEAPELSEATTDPAVFHRPLPPNRFDPSLYRGPGAPGATLAVPGGGGGGIPAPGAPDAPPQVPDGGGSGGVPAPDEDVPAPVEDLPAADEDLRSPRTADVPAPDKDVQ
jgi:Zn-finger in Ran binding protein and others